MGTMHQEPALFLFKRLWHFAEPLKKRVVLYVILSFGAQGINLLAPLWFGLFIDQVQKYGSKAFETPMVYALLAVLFVNEIAFWLFHWPSRVIERSVAFSAALNYRRHLLTRVLNLRLDWHNDHDSGDTIDKVNKAGEGLFLFGENVFQIIQIIGRVLGTALVLIWFSTWIGISVFILCLFSFWVILRFDHYLVPQYQRLNRLDNKASASVFDALSNITSVKILHIETPILEGTLSRFKAPQELYNQNARLNEWKWFTGTMLFKVIGLAPIAFYLYQAGPTVEAGKISALYLYLYEMFSAYMAFGSTYEQLMIYKNRLINANPIEEAYAKNTQTHRIQLPDWQTFEIRHLNFRYDEDREQAQLKDICLTLKRGERLAIIGESGSGKTTFLKVLHGLYPNANAELPEKSFADLDLKTMLVPQEPEVFSSTIRENITLGMPYEDSEVWHFAQMAAFDSVIRDLPKGLDSVINEKGVNLSGGQKQRLALTRALLFAADKELILLDESTSSVDPKNEEIIYANILEHFRGKTVIASIHKTHLLPFFDRVLRFEAGHLVERC